MTRCNGENCLSIANDYINKKSSLNSSLNSMKENITNASDTLNSLSVPEDYIGNKVKQKLESIHNELVADAEIVGNFNKEISGFVDQKVTEHRNHYHNWRMAQEELFKKKNELVNDTEKDID